MEEYAPIAVFVYNRPDHARKTIEALGTNELAKKSIVFIFSDASANEQNENKVAEVRSYIHSGIDIYFKELNIVEAEANKGLANSLIDGITRVISEYGRIIVLEDDLVVSNDYLDYMNRALMFYNDDRRIWSIGGFSFDMPCLKDCNADVYLHPRACSWGWATWLNRWELVDWNMPDYETYKHNVFKRYSFSKCGIDLPTMLDAQMYCNINSWYIRWCFYSWKENAYTVYPVKSRVYMIGNDGTGVHENTDEMRFNCIFAASDEPKARLTKLEPNDIIRRQYNKIFSPYGWLNFKGKIKWMLVRVGILDARKRYFWQK